MDAGRACPARGRGEGRTALHWAARGGHEEVCVHVRRRGITADKLEAALMLSASPEKLKHVSSQSPTPVIVLPQ